jgi:hypothetical protein
MHHLKSLKCLGVAAAHTLQATKSELGMVIHLAKQFLNLGWA